MSAVPVYQFTCPTCGEDIYMNEGMRERLLESGCIICETAVSATDFERT
jgi:predicted RNA-binding Zn-ribbon protein involved in translation (DUF1610 family)